MDVKVGDTFKSILDEMDFIIKKIVNDVVILESPDKKRQILTGVNSLRIRSFYLRKENQEL